MKKIFCLSLLLFQMIFFFRLDIFAISNEFETESFNQSREEEVLSRINISLLTEEAEKWPIECFDVNENGMVVLGLADPGFHSSRNYLYVYSSDGVFQYGYSFETAGSFYVEWNQDNIEIYFVRSNIVVILNPQDQTKRAVEITFDTEVNSYINNVLSAREREVGDTKYIIQNDMGVLNLIASSYSQVLVVNGEETITIYDINSTVMTRVIIKIVTVCLMACLVILGLLIQCLYLYLWRNKIKT